MAENQLNLSLYILCLFRIICALGGRMAKAPSSRAFCILTIMEIWEEFESSLGRLIKSQNSG